MYSYYAVYKCAVFLSDQRKTWSWIAYGNLRHNYEILFSIIFRFFVLKPTKSAKKGLLKMVLTQFNMGVKNTEFYTDCKYEEKINKRTKKWIPKNNVFKKNHKSIIFEFIVCALFLDFYLDLKSALDSQPNFHNLMQIFSPLRIWNQAILHKNLGFFADYLIFILIYRWIRICIKN